MVIGAYHRAQLNEWNGNEITEPTIVETSNFFHFFFAFRYKNNEKCFFYDYVSALILIIDSTNTMSVRLFIDILVYERIYGENPQSNLKSLLIVDYSPWT